MAHTITLNQAATLISAFLNNKVLGPIGLNTAIGGVIDLDIPEEGINGWTFWYAWNQDDGNFPEFFISYEPNVYTDSSPDDMEPASDYLLKPYDDYIFNYPSSLGKTVQDVTDFLEDQKKEWETTKEEDEDIDKADVEEFAARFLTDFPVKDSINPFCSYAFTFMKGDEIDEFVDQGSYVRYFFGYDDNVTPNQIRLILVSVDSDGSNQVGSGFYMMESGWPPNV
jgi:hypothetical protein